MAGSITYARTVAGTLGTNTYNFQDTTTGVISNGWVNDYSIAAATWTVLMNATYAANDWRIGIINKGSNPAVYRIRSAGGATYWRFNIPAGKAVMITGSGAYGVVGNGLELAVYSTLGTDLQVGYFY